MKFFLGKSSQHPSQDRGRVSKDFYDIQKTVSSGFPNKPLCVSFDHRHRLLAIGTENGAVQIYGKPGVEFQYQFEPPVEIEKILFVSKSGRLICQCSDKSLHLFQIPLEPSAPSQSLVELHQNNQFCNDDDEEPTVHRFEITALALDSMENRLFVGLKSGNIHVLNVSNLKPVVMTDNNKIIKQDDVLKNLKEELKFKPGAVEVIEAQPGNDENILIGYNRCLIALWDFQNDTIKNYFVIDHQLEHLSWNRDGQKFISCHNDGSYLIWAANQQQHRNENSVCPYGPFPCRAIKKIFWHTSNEGEHFIFSGGMPRTYNDKETVSIIQRNKEDSNNPKEVALDLTSKVLDFAVLFSEETEQSEPVPQALVILAVEELVVIDLQHPDWLQFKLPYLACLHSSAITCSQYYAGVSAAIYDGIVEAGEIETTVKYSTNEWPVNGGICSQFPVGGGKNLLITGHEDGTIRFWDATIALKHLYTLYTSKIFNASEEDDIALIDCDDQDLNGDDNGWPPFRKVGQFDPYSDDPRFAIRKLSFSTEKGILAVGGTAGQLIVYEPRDKPNEFAVNSLEMKIIDEKDSFVWKGHRPLPVRKTNVKFNIGHQPSSLVQLHPPAAVTALEISIAWQVIGVGTTHGFGLYNYPKQQPIISRSTLKLSHSSSIMGGDALISRRKSFKKSLRESFRRLRRSRSQKSKRNVSVGGTGNAKSLAKIQEANRGFNKYDSVETKPVERPVEATKSSSEDMMSSMVRYLYFCSSSIISNHLCPSFWVGTNAGAVFIYVLTNDKNSPTTTCWQLAKEVQLKHKAPVVLIRLVDLHGAPLFEDFHTENEKSSPTRILICSEEQFKLFSLPHFKTINKFKLTAHEGARVRKMEIGKFLHKTNDNQQEYSLMCLTNLGDVNIFSLPDFRRKFLHQLFKKENIHGISSLIFSNNGEGFYLKSASEYQRFTLSARKNRYLESYITVDLECDADQPTETGESTETNNDDDLDHEEEEETKPEATSPDNSVA